MKKPLLFIATALLFSFVVACTPEEIDKDTPKKVDIEKKAKDGGNQVDTTDIPR